MADDYEYTTEGYKYTYVDNTTQGYVKVKLSKEEHKNIFNKYYKGTRYEYYENEDSFIFEAYADIWVKLITVVLYPVLLLINGIGNIKELNGEVSDLFHEKERGIFYRGQRYKSDLIEKNIKFVDHFLKTGSED